MSKFAAEYLAKFGTEKPQGSEVCQACSQTWYKHVNATCPTGAKSKTPTAVETPTVEWALDVEDTSLSGSSTPYRRGHIRVVDTKHLRLQGHKYNAPSKTWEDTSHGVSGALVKYLTVLPHTCPSVANTGTSYIPCRLRRLGKTVRVQVAGPEFNRPWGVEFDLPGLAFAPDCIGPVTLPPPATPKAPKVGDVFYNPSKNECQITAISKDLVTGKNLTENFNFEITLTSYTHGLTSGFYTLKLKPPCRFAVGDKVVVMVQGDGCGKNKLTDGCSNGPLVGTVGTITVVGEKAVCGSLVLAYLKNGKPSHWTCTPAHLAHVPVPTKNAAPFVPGQAVVFIKPGCPIFGGPAAQPGDHAVVVKVDNTGPDVLVSLADGNEWWTGLDTIIPLEPAA